MLKNSRASRSVTDVRELVSIGDSGGASAGGKPEKPRAALAEPRQKNTRPTGDVIKDTLEREQKRRTTPTRTSEVRRLSLHLLHARQTPSGDIIVPVGCRARLAVGKAPLDGALLIFAPKQEWFFFPPSKEGTMEIFETEKLKLNCENFTREKASHARTSS
jgi:hypothetical protein